MWPDAARATAAAALRPEAPKQRALGGAKTSQSLTIGLYFHGPKKRIINQPATSGPHPQKTPQGPK